ncbi:unnamed protein product [Miscanthus lutarioriparius]|uniref:Uncharacterized protein n=1 Tax=Miscanthus lutarioriparius TaxID=422564 RepID=A0A811Q7J0_9POAL|nr:unnamed protein product [Miscanthus lutarioriparius]
MVGDPRLLSNLHDVPAGMRIRAADGNTMPITKIGDIQMITADIRNPGVCLVPGLKLDLISVHQFMRSRICTWFEGDRAMLYAGTELVGIAVTPQENFYGLYILQFLSMPKIAAASRYIFRGGSLSSCLDNWLYRNAWSYQPPRKMLSCWVTPDRSVHMVGDPRLLSNLHDASAGMRIRAADGNTMPITKIGDI